MIPNRIINVIDNAGNRLTYESKTIRGNANYRDILTVITPASLNTVVIANYLLYDARNENITQYLVPSSLKGKDLIDPTHENYQDWAEWNVFEVSIHQNALAKISRHNKGKIGLSFNFVVKTADTRATNFVGYFGNEDVPESATEGDYYICELSTYVSTNAELTFNYGQYAIWVSDAWVKSASFTLIGNTTTKEISVDPSVVGIAPTVDDETANDIFVELGSIQDRVTIAESDIDDVEDDIADIFEGTQTVKKAEQDASGNVITTTYETKADATSKKAEIDGRLDTAESDINAVEGRLDTAEGEIDDLQEDVEDLETANMIKSYTYNPSTHVLTFTYFDNTTTSLDLPLESAIVDASYDNATKDITFTLQSGATLVVPLDDLVSGLASETWVTTNFIPKTALKTSFSGTPLDTNVISEKLAKDSLDLKENLANKITDVSVKDDTKYYTSKAVSERLLNLPIAELNNQTLRELFEGGQLLLNHNFDTNTVWNERPDSTQNISGGINTITATSNSTSVGIAQNVPNPNGNTFYTVIRFNSQSSNNVHLYTGGTNWNVISTPNVWNIRSIKSTVDSDVTYRIYQSLTTGQSYQVDYAYLYNMTSRGISSLTVAQMDYWFNVWQALKVSDTNAFSIIQNYASKTLEQWLTPTLTTATSTYIRYRKDTLGTVIVEGNITVTTAGTNFTMPVGYRPLFAYTVGILTFNTNGTVVSSATGTQTLSVRYTGA